jgi:hypothetical protein
MIAGLILIGIGLLTLLLGIGGTAKAKIEGIGGLIAITLTASSGIILIVIGAIIIGVPP